MARRSPLNARYQKNQEPPGKTRKSAASAKPARAVGSSASTSTASKGKAAKKPSAASAVFRQNLQTPEYKKIHKRWWISLGAGVALVAVSWLVRAYTSFTYAEAVSMGALVLSYAAIFYALYLDFTKIRPMRQEAEKAAKAAKHPQGDSK